jgi:hypothetical protein
MFAVELKRHKGMQATPFGPVEVTFEQYLILVRQLQPAESAPMHVGYVGTQPNAPINWLRMPNGNEWPEPIKQAVRQHIAYELGLGTRKEGQPPAVQPAEELDDLDDLPDDTWDECYDR